MENFQRFVFENFPREKHVFSGSPADEGGTFPQGRMVRSADKVILHGLFDVRLMLFLQSLGRLPAALRERLYWVILGGDLYYHVLRKKRWRSSVLEMVRKGAIRRIGNVITGSKYPWDLLHQWYGVSPRRWTAFYPSQVPLPEWNEEWICQDGKRKLVLLGNSAYETNEHFEVLDVLKQLRSDHDFRVVCPLSYGNMEYARQVAKRGEEYFGKDFQPLFDLLPAEEYFQLLSGVDVAVMNHRRQQAFGNIRLLLSLGKKVYLRSEVYTFSFFRDIGIQLFDTIRLLDDADEGFLELDPEVARENARVVREYFSPKKCVENWQTVFDA